MAKAQGGSFIPKRSTGKVRPSRTGRRVYILSYIAYIFFFGTLLTVAGIYFLNRQAELQLAQHVTLLADEQANFPQNELNRVRNLHNRLQAAQQILASHIAPSRIFDELEPVVVESVQINTFSFERTGGGETALTLGGFTETFDELMFQREVIETSDFLSNADFVQVTYGGATNLIEGANRESVQQSIPSGPAHVSFVFEDASIAQRLGYQPRNSLSDNLNSSDVGSVETDTADTDTINSDATTNDGDATVNTES